MKQYIIVTIFIVLLLTSCGVTTEISTNSINTPTILNPPITTKTFNTTTTSTQNPTNTPTATPKVIIVLFSEILGEKCSRMPTTNREMAKDILIIVEKLPVNVSTPPRSEYWGGILDESSCFFISLPGKDNNLDDITFWYGQNNVMYWTYGTVTDPHKLSRCGEGICSYYSVTNGMWYWLGLATENAKYTQSPRPTFTATGTP